MNTENFAVIILAGGLGKRMKSKTPKVLHKVGEKPLIVKTVETVKKLYPAQIIVVVNKSNQKQIKKELGGSVSFALQKNALGTGDAAKVALSTVKKGVKNIAVLYGDDTAFYKPQTLKEAVRKHFKTGAKITFITLVKENPMGLGRIVRKNGKLSKIVEEKDATEKQKNIKEINDGFYMFQEAWIRENIARIRPSEATGELYLTELISVALKNNQPVETYKLKDPKEWHGINTKEELEEAKLKNIKRIHVMGVSGAGAAAVAGIAQKFGYIVSGCDISPQSPYSKSLNFKIQKGHSKSHLTGIDALIVSPAVQKLDPENEELLKAKELDIPTMTWQKFQGNFLQKNKFVIAVSGAYGKSTTTAMISQILLEACFDPTCEIGAKVLSWQNNFKVGKSKYYVCEADEYNNNFLNYKPDVAIILNADWDHPDFFKSSDDVLKSYENFVKNIKEGGALIIPKDKTIQKIAKSAKKSVKVVSFKDDSKIKLSIVGKFRTQNASAALEAAKVLNINPKISTRAIENFKGVGRRLEFKGKVGSYRIFDDYAVQPFTIEQTANALKDRFKTQKMILVIEPHTFSRMSTFFDDFVTSLKKIKADRILFTKVYSAREKGDADLLSKKLASEIGQKGQFTGSIEDTAEYIRKNKPKADIILSMGAGNSYKLYDLLKK